MGAIQQNVRENVLSRKEDNQPSETTGQTLSAPTNHRATTRMTTAENIRVLGHAWGTDTMYATESYGKPASPQPQPGTYDRIIIADCLWMPSQHANIVKTVLRYLVPHEGDTDQGKHISSERNTTSLQPAPQHQPCALVVAGFHTGRGIVRDFFGIATGEWEEQETEDAGREGEEEEDPELAEVSGRLKVLDMFEIDVDGNKRSWEPRREGETKDQAKRWCVCAVLGRR